jgi:transposase-like protein
LSHDEEFLSSHVYRIAYKPVRNAAYHSKFDIELACPSCGNNKWAYHARTGLGKLPEGQMKFKCVECGQWFICNRTEISKILGL